MTLVPEGPGELGRKIVADMERITMDRIGAAGLANARRNQARLSEGRSLAALRDEPVGEGDSAIVIAAGPSVARRNSISRIRESGYKGAIVACDSALRHCLVNGLLPDLVVTLDTHARRIVRWFGDPSLETAKASHDDDYFRRQDYDHAFARELETNREVIELCNRHGADIRIALSTSSSESVVSRVFDIGMKVYWWNPMYDDPHDPDGITRELHRTNRLPCVNAGGNVGTCCWMMAQEVLGKRSIALVGIDFAYYPDTPYQKTQYYHEAMELVGAANLDAVYIPVDNPYLDERFYTDPACMWYRQAFLELAADADCQTVNCTEGGILYGDGVEFASLDDFLAAHS